MEWVNIADWFSLATPGIALFGVFLGIGLVVQLVRMSRRVRRLEDKLADGGFAASDAPLERLRQLQDRMSISQGMAAGWFPPRARVLGAAAVAVVVLAFGAWALFGRGGGASGGTQTTPDAAGVTTTTASRPADPNLCGSTSFSGDVSLILIAVYNASGIDGKARENVDPLLKNRGYQVPVLDSSPDGRNDLAKTQVQYVAAEDRAAACSVARDLGVRPVRVTPLDGISPSQISDPDVSVVVLVGRDLASR